MKHLDFINKLNELGCHFRSTNRENQEKIIKFYSIFGDPTEIQIKNFNCNYKEELNTVCAIDTAFDKLLAHAIDIDEWKHCRHLSICPENYDKFIDIIQTKILGRAVEMDLLLTVYFLLKHKMSSEIEEERE